MLKAIPRSITRYPREIMRILAEVTLGTGALAVIGGTVGVIIGMTFFTGAQVGLSGYAALNQLGTAAFSGFVSAYFNTREIAPLVAGIALAATVGCGFTAQLGAMRISEEVDALEVMAIPSMPFLVATRVDRRADRDHPAVRRRAAVVVLRQPARGHPDLRPVARAPTTTTSTRSCRRATCSGPSARSWSSPSPSSSSTATTATTPPAVPPAWASPWVARCARSIVAINVLDLLLSMAIWGASTTVRLAG